MGNFLKLLMKAIGTLILFSICFHLYGRNLWGGAVVTWIVDHESRDVKNQYTDISTTSSSREVLQQSHIDYNTPPSTKLPTQYTGPIPVIVLTYMRSGSSFVGQLLSLSSDVFYLFEPIHKISSRLKKTTSATFQYLDKPARDFSSYLEVAFESLSNIVACNLENVTLTLWEDGFMKYSEYGRLYKQCMYLSNGHPGILRKCITLLKQKCKKSRHIVMKTIRLPMSILETMLENEPKLKIIHLMRDPRATLMSQRKYGLVKKNTEIEISTKFCNRVFEDLVKSDELEIKFPNRIKTVFYEDIARAPLEMAAKIYKFIDMDFSEDIEKKIWNMTSTGEGNGHCGATCTIKPNSTAQADEWRSRIKLDFAQTIDKSCESLYSKVGYRKVISNEELLNLSYPLRQSDTNQ